MWDEVTYPFPNYNGCTTLYNGCIYLYMLGLKLIYVSKRSHWRQISTKSLILFYVPFGVGVSWRKWTPTKYKSYQLVIGAKLAQGHWLALPSYNWDIALKLYSDVIRGAMASQITSLTIVYSTVYSGAGQRKCQSSALLAYVRGIHRWPANSPHKWPVTRKMFLFDDVMMRIDISVQRTTTFLILFCFSMKE